MIENDEDCSDVLVQISAVRSALNGLGKAIINEHITHCITHAIEDGDSSAVDEFKDASGIAHAIYARETDIAIGFLAATVFRHLLLSFRGWHESGHARAMPESRR